MRKYTSRPWLMLGLLAAVGCGYTGEANRILAPDTASPSRADRGDVSEMLQRALDEVDYHQDRPRDADPLLHGRLVERIHYLATFPTKLVMLTNLAEQRIMSPDPVNEQSIGRPRELPPRRAQDQISRLLASESGPRRLYGLALVREQGLREFGPRVVALLADSESSVRHEAARVVGKYRYSGAVAGLQRMATTDPDEFNRISAMQALALVAGKRCVPFLGRLALEAPSPFVRAKACGMLGNYPEGRSFRALVRCLQTDREWLVRDEAAGSLQRLTRISIPRSAYREPRRLDGLIARLRAWCRENKVEVLF